MDPDEVIVYTLGFLALRGNPADRAVSGTRDSPDFRYPSRVRRDRLFRPLVMGLARVPACFF